MKTKIISPDDLLIEQTPGDKKVLIKYAEKIKSPNCCVEIGTKYGGSALFIKQNTEVDVYTIDPRFDASYWKGAERESGINFIRDISLNVAKKWDKPIGLLFIDGCHDEAKLDFEAWEKHIVKGGYILFHDCVVHSPEIMKDCKKIAERKDYKVLYVPKSRGDITSIFQIQKL